MVPGDCLEPVKENQTLVLPLCDGVSEHLPLQQTFCGLNWMKEKTQVDLYFPAQPNHSCSLLLKKRVKTK